MKKMIGLLLTLSFAFVAFSAEYNSCYSIEKDSYLKADIDSELVIEYDFSLNGLEFDFPYGTVIDMTIDNSCEYANPAGETTPGYYDYAVVKHRDPGDSNGTCYTCNTNYKKVA